MTQDPHWDEAIKKILRRIKRNQKLLKLLVQQKITGVPYPGLTVALLSLQRLPLCDPWGPRIDILLRAAGWSGPEIKIHFGVSGNTLRKIKRGELKPNAHLVRRLNFLEERHRDDIEALKAGLITFDRYGRRADTRPKSKTPLRSPDLSTLG